MLSQEDSTELIDEQSKISIGSFSETSANQLNILEENDNQSIKTLKAKGMDYLKSKRIKQFQQYSDGAEFIAKATTSLTSSHDSEDITKLPNEIEQVMKLIYSESNIISLRSMFKGICIYVNGYTQPSADVLKMIMQLCGGEYSVIYESNRTTHTIAANLSTAQARSDRAKKSIVSPNWIMDSLKAGKLLNTSDYLVSKPKRGLKDYLVINDLSNSSTSICVQESTKGILKLNEVEECHEKNKQVCILDQINKNSNKNDCNEGSLNMNHNLFETLPKMHDISDESDRIEFIDLDQTEVDDQVFLESLNNSRKELKKFQKCYQIFYNQMKPNLCGLTSIDQTTALIREWILLIDNLIEEDVNYLLRYTTALIQQKQDKSLKTLITSIYGAIVERSTYSNDIDLFKKILAQIIEMTIDSMPSLIEQSILENIT